MIRPIAFVVAASVIAASCSNSPEALPTSTEQVVSTTAAETTTTETSSETTEELVERLGGAVVRLDVAACDGEYVGAGFLIDEHHIVTVAHNIVGAELIAATTGVEIAIAEPVGMDVLRDIALLRTDIPMGDVYFDLEGSEPVVGQDLILFGFPLGLDLTVTRGIVSNADVELPDEPLLRFVQIDAAANPGNSGGPVVTAEGDLIGILQSGFVDFEGLNFATKLTVVERLLNSWVGSPSLLLDDCGALEGVAAPSSSNPSSTPPNAGTNTSSPGNSSTTTTIDSGIPNSPAVLTFEGESSFGYQWFVDPTSYWIGVSDADGISDPPNVYLSGPSTVTCELGHPLSGDETEKTIIYFCPLPSMAGSYSLLVKFTDDRGAYSEANVRTIEYVAPEDTPIVFSDCSGASCRVSSNNGIAYARCIFFNENLVDVGSVVEQSFDDELRHSASCWDPYANNTVRYVEMQVTDGFGKTASRSTLPS